MSFKLPEKKQYVHAVSNVTREKSVSSIIDSAVNVLGEQIERISLKSRSMSLDDKDVKNLRQYISALTELSREEREREKADDLSKYLASLSDDQLLDYAQKKLSALK